MRDFWKCDRRCMRTAINFARKPNRKIKARFKAYDLIKGSRPLGAVENIKNVESNLVQARK